LKKKEYYLRNEYCSKKSIIQEKERDNHLKKRKKEYHIKKVSFKRERVLFKRKSIILEKKREYYLRESIV
jgi:hypothetical protein